MMMRYIVIISLYKSTKEIQMKKFTELFCMVCILVLSLAACGKQDTDDGVRKFHSSLNDSTTEAFGNTTTDKENSQKSTEDLFIVSDIDSVQETIMVYSYTSGLEYQYYYGLGTEFLNKYGDHMSVGNIGQGDAVYISGTDSSGKVKQVQKSDKVWTNDTVKNFSVDKDKGMLTIGTTKYRIDDNTMIFSGDDVVEADSITSQDTLSVVGIDKQIVSVAVKTGHGTLQLKNTSLFEGSFLQLGNSMFAEITPDMSLEVPEGTYTLAVANNGWGGTTDIEIKRGETTTVNLDDLKGEGPQKSKILFEVDVEGAKIYVDGNQIDYSQPAEITYGKHTLKVTADGYDTWTRTLYVNSAEATIQITINDGTDSDSSKSSSSEVTAQTPSETASERATEKSSEKSSETTSSKTSTNSSGNILNSLTNSELADYVSTLTSLLGLNGT